MQANAATRPPISPVALVLLMAFTLCINYVDRGNLATAGPLVTAEFSLTPQQFGWLGSAFYLTYTLLQFPAGWLADRYGARLVLSVGAAIWSITTLGIGFAPGFLALLLLRMALGVGESVAFTTTSKLIVAHVPTSRLGLANGVTGFGYLVGPAIGTYLGSQLMDRLGWRPVFVLFGLVSLLWLVPWMRIRLPEARGPARQAADADLVPTRLILRQRSLWGASLGHFCGNYNYYFLLFWLPTYLVSARGFSMAEMGAVAAAAYGLNAGAALFAGWAIDRWIERGGSATLAHKLPMALAHLLGIGCAFGLVTLPVQAALACLYVYQVVIGLSSPGYWAIPQLIAGPSATARWIGIQNMIGNSTGIIAPALTGWLVASAAGDYYLAFVVAGLVNLVGFFGWVILMGRVEPVDWQEQARRARSGTMPANPSP